MSKNKGGQLPPFFSGSGKFRTRRRAAFFRLQAADRDRAQPADDFLVAALRTWGRLFGPAHEEDLKLMCTFSTPVFVNRHTELPFRSLNHPSFDDFEICP